MAREKVKQVQVFSLPTEYERQAAEARRREMMAEMLAQQAYDPGQYQGAPIPKAAPVVKALEGYLRGREMRKAREAGEAAEKAGRTEFADYIRSFEPERRTVSTADVAAMEMPTPSIDASGRVAYTPASAIAAPNQQISGSSMTDPLQMQVGGPLTLAQRRARALEGFESTNPMVQQFAATQYEKTMPRELDLKLGAINPAEVDMASVAEAQRTGDISRIKPRAKPPEKGPTSIQEFEFAQTNPKFARFLEGRTPKTTVDVRYGAPVAGIDSQGNPVFFQPNPTGGPPSIISGVAPKPEPMNVSEATSALFADRAARAEPIFDQLPPPSLSATAKGELGGIGNVMLTPENRQFFQAERNFITAVLRKESGASIPPNEYADARRVYIPQAGDDEKTLEMKRQARQDAINGIARGAGPTYKAKPLERQIVWTPEKQKELDDLNRKRQAPGR